MVSQAVMSRIFKNGTKVLIEDSTILGQARRHISVFNKEGKLLSQRVKFWLKKEPLVDNFGADFATAKHLITVDSVPGALNDTVKERVIRTSYSLNRDLYSPTRPYPNIGADGKKTAVFNVYSSRFDEKFLLDGRALFNIDGTISTKTQNFSSLGKSSKMLDTKRNLTLEYPPVHSSFIDKWC